MSLWQNPPPIFGKLKTGELPVHAESFGVAQGFRDEVS